MNSGKVNGEDVIQLYVRDVVGEVTRPVLELKGFKKVFVTAGQSVTVTFKLTPADLKYYHSNMNYSWDPGEFEIHIGPNSAQTKIAKFTLK